MNSSVPNDAQRGLAGRRRIAGMEYERQDMPGGWVTWIAREDVWTAQVKVHGDGYFDELCLIYTGPNDVTGETVTIDANEGWQMFHRAFPLVAPQA